MTFAKDDAHTSDEFSRWPASHRPFPLPKRPWVGFMSWRELLFAHWPIDPRVMRERVPRQLELDTFDGAAWIAVVPFVMSNVRPRFSPIAMPDFPELNVRTYVTYRGVPGLYFFSLDAASRLLVWGGRTFVSLPYYNATMDATTDATGWTHYTSDRTHPGAAPARWAGRYRPVGPVARARPGSLEHFLTERYCLYSITDDHRVLRGDVHHGPWPLQPAEAEIEVDTMLEPIDLARPASPPLLHFAKRIDVQTWWPVPPLGREGGA